MRNMNTLSDRSIKIVQSYQVVLSNDIKMLILPTKS